MKEGAHVRWVEGGSMGDPVGKPKRALPVLGKVGTARYTAEGGAGSPGGALK